MSKLFKFEKTVKELIYDYRMKDILFNTDELECYSTVGSRGLLKNNIPYEYNFKFYHVGEKNIFELTLYIGKRYYSGYFNHYEYNLYRELIYSFVRFNS